MNRHLDSGTSDPADLRVLIIGAGIGGLCLAQGLRRAGIAFTVFDRAPSLVTRRQGYGFHINQDGDHALRACLPTDLYELHRATSSPAPTGDFVLYSAQLQEIFRRPLPAPPRAYRGVGVNRQTLREILSAGIDDAIRYDSDFQRYGTSPDGRPVAYFTGGETEAGALIVGADGAGSAVRHQLLPGAEFDDTGRAIYGRTPLTPELRAQIPADFIEGMARARDERGIALAAAAFISAEPLRKAGARLASGVQLTEVGDHLRWTLSRRGESPAADTSQFWGSGGAELHTAVADMVASWHPALRAIVDAADAEATYPFGIFCARPVEPWTVPGVTLLGDAIHTMTPGRGEGANTALRDAQLLTERLIDVASGRSPLSTAKQLYEAEMLRYGFEAVERSRAAYFAPAMKPQAGP
ncbi:FAD-dependent oxidoreductase [Dactylosporangium sp. CA-092794]|uniref:FAD-dependent oxidoreductase n=1 Tax=Dactylosporangium sp. CA-092794 TaxID=3239929 RepID=UPI003D8F3392